MTTDVLDFDVEPAATTAAPAAAPAASNDTSPSTASTPEVAAVASGSLASEPTSASAAPSVSSTGDADAYDVMESQLDLREPKAKPSDASVADSAAASKNDAVAGDAASPATSDSPFSEDDLALASFYGFAADDVAKSFKTPDALRAVLTALDRRELSAATPPQSQSTAAAEDRTAPAATAVKQGDVHAATSSSQPDLAALGIEPLELDLSAFDEDAAAILRKIADHSQTQMAKALAKAKAEPTAAPEVVALKEQLAALEAKEAQRDRAQFEQDMDGFFTGLDKAYADKFGTGPVRSLAKDSAQLNARNELVREYLALREADARLGRPEMPREQTLKRALAARFADQVQELARKQVRAEVEDRRAQAVEKPTQRTVPVETGDAAAVSWVNSFLKNRGVEPQESMLAALSEIE
jgi:hypothetical protein